VLKIRKLDHVSVAVWKVEDHLPLLTELFGMKLAGDFRSEEDKYQGVVLDIAGGKVQWEVLEPTSEDSFVARFLQERGPGLHHVTFQVEDVTQAAEVLRQRGIEPFRGVRTGPTWRETFLHPRDTGGVLIQLFDGDWS
jgi:methylmalonyl-CoA/ethylmalonyl-CoA epimerase